MVASTPESEWNDVERDKMRALSIYEAGVHDVCGLHDSIAKHDPHITIEADTCPLCAAIEAKARVFAEADHTEAEALRERPGARRRADGRRRFVRLLTPDEIAEAQATSHPM